MGTDIGVDLKDPLASQIDESVAVAQHGPFLLLPTRAVPTRDATFDEWEKALEWARSVEEASPFWVGDLLAYGEHKYGEMYAQAIEVTGQRYGTLANAVYVARRVDTSLRSESLTFSHHKEVAPLPPEEQREWLAKAVVEDLTVEQLRHQIRLAKAYESERAVEVWLLVKCKDVDDQQKLIERMQREGRAVKPTTKQM